MWYSLLIMYLKDMTQIIYGHYIIAFTVFMPLLWMFHTAYWKLKTLDFINTLIKLEMALLVSAKASYKWTWIKNFHQLGSNLNGAYFENSYNS